DFTIDVEVVNQAPTDIMFMGNGSLDAGTQNHGSGSPFGGGPYTTTEIAGDVTLFSMATVDPDSSSFTYRFANGSTSAALYSESNYFFHTFTMDSAGNVKTNATGLSYFPP